MDGRFCCGLAYTGGAVSQFPFPRDSLCAYRRHFRHPSADPAPGRAVGIAVPDRKSNWFYYERVAGRHIAVANAERVCRSLAGLAWHVLGGGWYQLPLIAGHAVYFSGQPASFQRVIRFSDADAADADKGAACVT